MEAVIMGAAGVKLAAVRDTAERVWQLATSPRDRAGAAVVLAHAARAAGDPAECQRWAQRAADLGDRAGTSLLQGQGCR
jgi:hypothetical protein